MEHKPFLTQEILSVAKETDFEFILSEAKDRLNTTMDIADNLTNRSVTLFSIAAAALTTALGYVASHFVFAPTTLVAGAVSILLWMICSKLKKNITPNDYYAVGADPSTITVNGMFKNLEGREPKWYLMAHLIDKYEERIVRNRAENDIKAHNFKGALNFVYGIPGLVFLIYSLFLLFPKLLG